MSNIDKEIVGYISGPNFKVKPEKAEIIYMTEVNGSS